MASTGEVARSSRCLQYNSEAVRQLTQWRSAVFNTPIDTHLQDIISSVLHIDVRRAGEEEKHVTPVGETLRKLIPPRELFVTRWHLLGCFRFPPDSQFLLNI